MARWHSLVAGFLALGALASGCATNRPGNPFGSASSKSSAAQLAKKSAKNGSATDGDKNSSGSHSDLAATKSSKTDDDDSSPDGDAALAKAAKEGGHDPETMAYINKQLKDATPAERTALLAELKGLHAEAVRQILRGRRMAINLEHQQELAAQRNNGSASPGTIQQTAGESAAGSSRVNTARRFTKRSNGGDQKRQFAGRPQFRLSCRWRAAKFCGHGLRRRAFGLCCHGTRHPGCRTTGRQLPEYQPGRCHGPRGNPARCRGETGIGLDRHADERRSRVGGGRGTG